MSEDWRQVFLELQTGEAPNRLEDDVSCSALHQRVKFSGVLRQQRRQAMTDDPVPALPHQLERSTHGFKIALLIESRQVESRRRELCCHSSVASLPPRIHTDRTEITEVL